MASKKEGTAVTFDMFATEFGQVMADSFKEYQAALADACTGEEVLELHSEFLMFNTNIYAHLVESVVESRGIVGFKNGHH